MFERGNTKRLCRQLGLREDLMLLEKAWESEIGGMAAMARIVALDNYSLLVEVTTSPAMHELTMRRKELLRRVNRYFSDPFIRDIQVRMAQHG